MASLSQNDKLIYLRKSIGIDSFLCMILEIYLRKYSTRINPMVSERLIQLPQKEPNHCN